MDVIVRIMDAIVLDIIICIIILDIDFGDQNVCFSFLMPYNAVCVLRIVTDPPQMHALIHESHLVQWIDGINIGTMYCTIIINQPIEVEAEISANWNSLICRVL